MAGTTNPDAARGLSDSATDVLTRRRRMAVPTDADDDTLRELRAAAVDLAVRFDLDVVLYDRSAETWMDHPHPTGLCDRDAIDTERHPHLLEQMDQFTERGVSTSVWIATVPSLSEIVDVIRELDVDVILVPAEGNGGKMLDRLKSGGPAEIVEQINALDLDDPADVLVRHDDGFITPAAPAVG
jgi:nucleotide-binding universal stress UspA family protein